MIDDNREVRPASERTFAMIRVDGIDILNARARGKLQFEANVRSISDNGLYKPILVNARDHRKTGRYQLICGQGRWEAHKQLKKELIKAEIVDVDLATAHIMSLGENMTKCQPQAVEYAYALQEMSKQGTSIQEMERITGKSSTYVRSYIRLVEQGEERLIKGVEQGVFTLEFAMKVAECPEGAIQHLLMDAFDKKLITAKQVDFVRKILEDRNRLGGSLSGGNTRKTTRTAYSVDDLKRDITKITKEREMFTHEVEAKQTRLIRLSEALKKVRADPKVMEVLGHHKLAILPDLQGRHGI